MLNLDCSTKIPGSEKMPSTCSTYCDRKSCVNFRLPYIYNMLKNTRRESTSVTTLLNQVDRSDEQLEGNLCTMLQNVRGTKQYWFLRHSELKYMIRDFGPPTLFLTFSCAEYESTEIGTFLKRVNGIPDDTKCSIGKLCTEDPLSVSRQFSLKFHSSSRQLLLRDRCLVK